MMAREERRRSALDWFVSHPAIDVRVWSDPTIDGLGYAVRDPYVEWFWLPVLGPSAVFAARRIAAWLDSGAASVSVDLVELGASLGLGTGTGRHAQINRTLGRLIDFGMARIGDDHLDLHTTWPSVPERLRQRLPLSLVDALADHERQRVVGDTNGFRKSPLRGLAGTSPLVRPDHHSDPTRSKP